MKYSVVTCNDEEEKMNNKSNAIKDIEEFLKSNERCMLITGTHQFKKHVLIMALIDKYYKNAKVLFRTNGVGNAFDNRNILGQFEKKKHKAGEYFKINNNYYCVDSFNREDTCWKTNDDYNFAILYPLDAITRKDIKTECIRELLNDKKIDKIFLVSWTDHREDELSIYNEFVDAKTIYDAEEEDIHYHRRVLGLE
jgi:hypothetical protein